MPGIVGIVCDRPTTKCERLVKSMVGSMEHERFYVSGTYVIPDMGVYAGWVAHENSFAARQVIFNERRDVALIFSGECFVDPDVLADLKQKGHRFGRGNGDWLVHLYEELGDRLFEDLNGLFSGLLIDKRQREAFLFNDRYGVERIYWHEADGEFYFASEAKALLRILPELRKFDTEGVAHFLAFGCTLDTRTLFRGVQSLPGGSLWSFKDGRCRRQKYFSPESWEHESILSADAFEAEFQDTFKRVLPRYFESQSKIGISLTAGLDSRMIMACLPETTQKPVCYTFSGEQVDTLDARRAASLAAACGLDHHTLRIGPDFFADFASHVDRTVYATDGCLGALGAHEIYMNRQARRLAPTRLTGNYGSEVLRNTSTFKPLELSAGLFNPAFGDSVHAQVERLINGQPVTFAAFREIPWKRFGVLAAGRSQSVFRTPYLDNQIVALAYRTPQALQRSSLPALRLIRDCNRALSGIPTDMGELGRNGSFLALTRRAVSRATFKLDYLNNEGFANWLGPVGPIFGCLQWIGIVGLHKHLHYRSWFRRELADYVRERLGDSHTRRCWFWNADFLDRMAMEHICGSKNYVFEIDAVLTLEAVERLLFRGLPYLSGKSPISINENEDSNLAPCLP